jgi:hypothetical protein
MKRGPRCIAIAVAAAVGAVVTFLVLSESGAFNTEVWEREDPLVNPSTVASVREGTITLVDRRAFRPAGVGRRDEVSSDDYDRALRVIVAQGVVVIRDLGDGRAFLVAEPRFYNWCGTRAYNANPWARWAGSYLRCPVSELLIQLAYAKPVLDQPGLSSRERWRLEGVGQIGGVADSPTPISQTLAAFRYNGSERYLGDYDTMLETVWKPPPSP